MPIMQILTSTKMNMEIISLIFFSILVKKVHLLACESTSPIHSDRSSWTIMFHMMKQQLCENMASPASLKMEATKNKLQNTIMLMLVN